MRAITMITTMAMLGACGSGQPEPAMEKVSQAWVTLPAASGRPAAAYFTLSGGESDDRLIALDSPDADRIELHQTLSDNGRIEMRPIDSVALAQSETVIFAPGGRHAMLFGIDPAIEAGSPIVLNFRFASGRDLQIEAVTVTPGSANPFAGGG